MGGSVRDVNSKGELDEVVTGGSPAVLHFWASWCEASKHMDQLFSHLASDFPHTHFLRVEAEEQPEISEAYFVSAVPFFVFFKILSEFTSTMARPIESVMDINYSKDLWKIVVRCRHLWTVRSSSNKEHLELILVDSKLDMIQAIVPFHLVSKYVGDLAVGASYIMQNFKVSNNDFSFKSTTQGYKLVFCGSTYVKKTELPEIPIDYFKILGLASIADGKF